MCVVREEGGRGGGEGDERIFMVSFRLTDAVLLFLRGVIRRGTCFGVVSHPLVQALTNTSVNASRHARLYVTRWDRG